MALPQRVLRNPDRTRRRILQAAIRLFAKHGFHAVSVDQIVGQARVNKRMVYHYFGSKDALFEAALSEVYKRIEEIEFHAVERGPNVRVRRELGLSQSRGSNDTRQELRKEDPQHFGHYGTNRCHGVHAEIRRPSKLDTDFRSAHVPRRCDCDRAFVSTRRNFDG